MQNTILFNILLYLSFQAHQSLSAGPWAAEVRRALLYLGYLGPARWTWFKVWISWYSMGIIWEYQLVFSIYHGFFPNHNWNETILGIWWALYEYSMIFLWDFYDIYIYMSIMYFCDVFTWYTSMIWEKRISMKVLTNQNGNIIGIELVTSKYGNIEIY